MFQYKCLNPISEKGLALFDENYSVTDDLAAADAVLVRSASMHDLEGTDHLLAVARAGAGVNNIPISEYATKGIVVFNTPGANANGVKELVIAGMLLASRDLLGGNRWVAENQSDANITKSMEKAKKAFAGNEIQGKKLGVIGLGAIGVMVANASLALGMDVCGYDPYLTLKSAWNLSPEVKQVKTLDEIFENCDFITIHVPLLDSTRNMIGKDGIARMKENAVILNFARNGLVEEEAVVSALAQGKIAHYVTDFPTPLVAGKDGVIAFPHLGASTAESEENCAVMAAKQVKEYLETGSIINSVNLPNLDIGAVKGDARVCIISENTPDIMADFTETFARTGVSVAAMSQNTRGDYSYAAFDLSQVPGKDVIASLQEIDGVIRVRLIG